MRKVKCGMQSAEWCVECGMRKACNQGVLYCLFFAPAWIFHSNVCSSCLTSLHVNVKQINELNVCWNMVFRRIFQYNKWEPVRAVIDGCGRLDVKHLILLCRIQFYRRIFYTNDNVLHKLFCTLLLSDCMYDNCMISVFTRDAASNVYMQFRADLTVWCVDELIQFLYLF